MYHSITIKNFRCFESLVADNFTSINLITGDNNVGKTALLEALWLHSAPNNPDLGLRLHKFRGVADLEPRNLLYDLHYNLDTEKSIELVAHGSWGDRPRSLEILRNHVPEIWIPFTQPNGSARTGIQERESRIRVNSELLWLYTDQNGETHKSFIRWSNSRHSTNKDHADLGIVTQTADLPPFPITTLLSPRFREAANVDCELFSDLIKLGKDHFVVNCLQCIDSRLNKLVILTTPMPMLYVDTGLKQFIPVGFLGDGVNRLLSMALAVFGSRNGILLIDEIENGIHHSKLPEVWRNLSFLATNFNVQVFATTHSEECIRAVHTALAGDSPETLSIHRLDQHENVGQIATTYRDESLDYAVEYGSEMR